VFDLENISAIDQFSNLNGVLKGEDFDNFPESHRYRRNLSEPMGGAFGRNIMKMTISGAAELTACKS
jgi:hypothetical protein